MESLLIERGTGGIVKRMGPYSLPVAAALFFLALVFPIWTVIMKAPTYPERSLAIRVYANKFEGDVAEWNRVGRLVGVKVPPPIPDAAFVALPAAFALLGGLSLLAWAWRRWRPLVAALGASVLLISLGWGQYSLYLFGHNLDPDRPLRFLKPFTPPIIGILTMGKITTYHLPHVGGILLGLATLLLVLTGWRQWRPPAVRGSTRSPRAENTVHPELVEGSS